MSILIGVGGGQSRGAGGAAGAVRYDEAQQLTEAQQMLARKNQGLYYEGEGAVRVLFDEDGTFKRAPGESPSSAVGLYHSSDATPAKNTIIDCMTTDGTVINAADVLIVDGNGGYGLYADEFAVDGGYCYVFVALEDNARFAAYSGLAKGIWLRNAGYGSKTEWVEYAGNVISKVPEKFLPDDSLTTAEIDTIWDSVMD